jgi:hypothetical protein
VSQGCFHFTLHIGQLLLLGIKGAVSGESWGMQWFTLTCSQSAPSDSGGTLQTLTLDTSVNGEMVKRGRRPRYRAISSLDAVVSLNITGCCKRHRIFTVMSV